MSFKKSVYREAKNALDERKKAVLQRVQTNRSEVLMKCPELMEIENEMAQCGLDAVKAIGMGKDSIKFIADLAAKNLSAQEKKKALLKENGYSEDYLEPKWNCEKCKDTGYHDGLYCLCYKKLIKETAKKEIEKIAPIKRSTFSTFRTDLYPDITDKILGVNQRQYMTKIYNYCRDYADDFSLKSKNLLMLGATGLGKTHLSLAIANAVIDKGYGVYYNSIQNIMEKLEREHFGKSNGEESAKEDILSADLLIIDDLGVEFSTQFTVAELHSIINSRILKGLPTIINTNLEVEDIEKQYSQRIASRIIGTSMPLRFCGEDIRQKK